MAGTLPLTGWRRRYVLAVLPVFAAVLWLSAGTFPYRHWLRITRHFFSEAIDA